MSIGNVVSVVAVGFVVVLGCATADRDTPYEADTASAQSALGNNAAPIENALSNPIAQATCGTTQAFCSTSCGSAPAVSCSGSSCSAQERNCAAGQPGHVTCDGLTRSCGPCGCTEGATRYESTGGCCCNYDDPTQPQPASWVRVLVCTNSVWVERETACRGGNTCGEGICPM